jgi:hypothetical protein
MPRQSVKSPSDPVRLDFKALVEVIQEAHEQSAAVAGRVVNITLTLRNWAIGWYIREYEHAGLDRAEYGEALLERVAEGLKAKGFGDLTPR